MDTLERDARLEERAAGAETGSDTPHLTPENTVAMDADRTLTLECGMKSVSDRLAEKAGGKTAYLAALHKTYGREYWKIAATALALYRAPLVPPLLRVVEEGRIRTLVSLVKNQDASVTEEAASILTMNPLLLFTTYTHQPQTEGKDALIIGRGLSQGISYFLDNPDNPTLARTVEECTKMNLPQAVMEEIFEAFQERSLTPRRMLELFGYHAVYVAAHDWKTTNSAAGTKVFTGDVEPNGLARELFGGSLITLQRKLDYPCTMCFGDWDEQRYIVGTFMRKPNFINVENRPATLVDHFCLYLQQTIEGIYQAGERYRKMADEANHFLHGRTLLSRYSLPAHIQPFLESHHAALHQLLDDGEQRVRQNVRNLINFVNYTTGIDNQELLVAARALP